MTTPEPQWFLRVNPLRRSRLADPEQRRLLRELTESEAELAAAAELCSQELYERIGAVESDTERRELIALRRAIHNGRAPRKAPESPEARTPAVRRWLAAHQERERLRTAVTEGYPAASDRERAVLARLLGDDDLLRSLALVAPEVHQEAERYRSAVEGPGKVSARTRKSERGLIQYVTRAMVRTSPLSRFTAVGIAEPAPASDREAVRPGEVSFTGARAVPGLDRVMLHYVLGGLPAARDAELSELWVGVPPTSAPDPEAGKLFFLNLTEQGMRRLALPLDGPVQDLLDALSMGPRRFPAVVAHVAGRAGCSAEEADRRVRQALRQGVLCTFHRSEESAARADYDDLLTPVLPATDRAAAVGALADKVRSALPRLADTPASARGAALAGLRADLGRFSQAAGRPAHVTVEEDYVMPPLKVASADWHAPLADVGPAVELLSVFDWLHDVRVLMTAAFVERFGAGANVPLAEHAAHIVGEVSRRAAAMAAVYGPQGTGEATALTGLGPADGSLERMYLLRRELSEEVHALLTKTAQAGADTLALSAGDVADLTRTLPDRFRQDPLIYGVLLQQAGDRLVLNDGLPGHGMLYARFLEADRRQGGRALPRLAARLNRFYGHDGARVTEDLGLHRLNVNAHTPVLPGGLTPEDWFGLRLAHDPQTDTLRVEDADGTPLRVLPLGTGHPGLFPPPLSVASGLVISGRLFNSLPNSWHAATPWDGKGTRPAPRMTVGDVVIGRRRWYGGTELDEAVAAGPDEHERLLALTAWRARHGVPEEVVIKSAPDDEGPLSVGAPDVQSKRLQQKPQYVDLSSALAVRVLPRMLERRGEGAGYLEEALPGVTDGTHATEWVLEVGRTAGGRFTYAPQHTASEGVRS
ncbi:lantibiotic dehydratase [Streptomyces sp. AC627_RSS907]|uniref:lantibiotic dehydratase n=1 Tax=Streptomyces sp. AC627_RSS907 TaxID=2823684 RepID=UPI001C233370|nr:lantibiotic dehydratase [Streptomyces sp. AC627_RSS907]